MIYQLLTKLLSPHIEYSYMNTSIWCFALVLPLSLNMMIYYYFQMWYIFSKSHVQRKRKNNSKTPYWSAIVMKLIHTSVQTNEPTIRSSNNCLERNTYNLVIGKAVISIRMPRRKRDLLPWRREKRKKRRPFIEQTNTSNEYTQMKANVRQREKKIVYQTQMRMKSRWAVFSNYSNVNVMSVVDRWKIWISKIVPV